MRLKGFFSNISNWQWFILLALLVRAPLWFYFGHLVNVNLPEDQKLYSHFVRDDYMYFFDPVDTYLRTGIFSYSHGQPFTGRMPGYSIVYLLFRFLFSPQIATYCIVVAQFLLSSISVYVLALTAYKIFENKRTFYIVYGLYILAVFPGFFDLIIVPESFSVSAFVFTLYYLTRYIKEGYNIKYLVLSGLFLTWTIFLREYTGLLIVVFPIAIGVYHLINKQSVLKAFKAGFIFCIPFIIADAAWTTRNYLATGKIIPVASADIDSYGKLYSAPWNALDDLVNTWGENGAPFDLTGMAYYYRTPSQQSNYKFPERIFNNVSTYNTDSLLHLRQLYATYYYTHDTIIEKQTQRRILELCTSYKQDYIDHNRLAYTIVRPIKDLKYLMFFSGTGYLPMPPYARCTLIEKTVKLVFTVLYFIIVICGFAGILLFIIRKQANSFLQRLMIISCIVIAGLLVLGTPLQEPRYSVHIIMVLTLFAGSIFKSKTVALLIESNLGS